MYLGFHGRALQGSQCPEDDKRGVWICSAKEYPGLFVKMLYYLSTPHIRWSSKKINNKRPLFLTDDGRLHEQDWKLVSRWQSRDWRDLKTNNTSTTIIGESRFPDELNTKAGIKEAKQRHQQRPEKSQHLKLKLCGRKSKTSQAKKAGVPPSCVSSGCKIS